MSAGASETPMADPVMRQLYAVRQQALALLATVDVLVGVVQERGAQAKTAPAQVEDDGKPATFGGAKRKREQSRAEEE